MNKQHNIHQSDIDTVARELCSRYDSCTCNERDGHCATPQQHAKIILELGYRKEAEVAAEIINEIASTIQPGSHGFYNFMLRKKLQDMKTRYNIK